MREFNPQLWFGDRKLFTVPKHFVRSNTPVTQEALLWVENKLIGRYACTLEQNPSNNTTLSSILTFIQYDMIYFEDPKELTFYELMWAGRNNFS